MFGDVCPLPLCVTATSPERHHPNWRRPSRFNIAALRLILTATSPTLPSFPRHNSEAVLSTAPIPRPHSPSRAREDRSWHAQGEPGRRVGPALAALPLALEPPPQRRGRGARGGLPAPLWL